MTRKERKALAVVLYTLGEIHCDDPRYGEVVTQLTDLLAGAEEEKEPNYVPTTPPDQPYSPWDWFAWLRKPMYKGPSDYPPGPTFTSYSVVPATCPCGKGSCEDCGKGEQTADSKEPEQRPKRSSKKK